MKFKNPIKEWRERKAEELRRQEEEKRRKEEEERRRKEEEERRRKEAEKKKKQKQALLAAAGLCGVVLLAVIFGIGISKESADPTVPDGTDQIEFVESSSTVEATQEPEKTQPPETEPPAESSEPTATSATEETQASVPPVTAPVIDLSSIPAFSGDPYVVLNGNVPEFTDADLTATSFETYSDLDSLGRCGVAYANIGQDLMPTEERGSIGQVRPSGWHLIKYDFVDGNYLYNRCHLIGYQLTAENANKQNLITGTRYLNVQGMLPFENMVADYIKETGNHVLYRVTPIFEGDNLVASGVHMEAESVEDNGDGILFNVYCYNVQPGVIIDYASGDSVLDSSAGTEPEREPEPEPTPMPSVEPEDTTPPSNSGTTYILNTNTHVFHYPSCSSVDRMSDKNKQVFTGTRDEAIAMGYEPCQRCNP